MPTSYTVSYKSLSLSSHRIHDAQTERGADNGLFATKADGSSEQAKHGQLQLQETLVSEPSPKPRDLRPFVGVLLDGIVTQWHEADDVPKRKVEQMFQDLGLGRGINATRVRPWLNRTSLQVRPVHFDDLIGTEEGGCMESYKKIAHSSHSVQMQTQAQAHVPVANGTAPVSPKVEIGVDCDYARTISTERCVVGRRVMNRTISFKENFQDLPFSESRRARLPRSTPLQPGAASGNREVATLEEELCKWILERYQCPSCRKMGKGSCEVEEEFEAVLYVQIRSKVMAKGSSHLR